MTTPRDAYKTADMIGKHVRTSRIRLGLTRLEASRLAQVSETTFLNLEHARKPIFAQRGKIHGYSDRSLQRIETALGWGWGTFLDLAEGRITEPWTTKHESNPHRLNVVPDVITLDWLMGMILRYKMQTATNGES